MLPEIESLQNFNPRTREGCDGVSQQPPLLRFPISIHAPVKGATPTAVDTYSVVSSISIHAPVKGATNMDLLSMVSPIYFNPRTREGCDYGFLSPAYGVP